MKKILTYIIGVAALTACSSEDLPYVMPDNYKDEITFNVGVVRNNEAGSRAAEHTHSINYDRTKHPQSLGVFGYANEVVDAIYYNERYTFDAATGMWANSADKKNWNDYVDKKPVYFLGYLCGDDDDLPSATVTNVDNVITLTIPSATIADRVLLATETGLDKAPLVCCKPIETETVLPTVNFDMDRTLTGYSVWFMLGEKMDNVRDFDITAVKVNVNAPKSGTIICTYQKTGTKWADTDKTVTWTNLGAGEDCEKQLEWKKADGTTPETLKVNSHTDFLKWGDVNDVTSQAFFAIPSATFEPTISVTYNVVLDDPNGDVITRKNITSTIQLNSTNFTSLNAGSAGKVNPIKIKIVPNYLYVLADKDQATGYLKLN